MTTSSMNGTKSVASERSQSDLAGSYGYIERARRVMPFGLSSSTRSGQRPTPIVIAKAQGSRLFDVDGNEYLDYAAGFGPMLLGHQPQAVLEAVNSQLARGVHFAAAHEGELELAERMVRLIPCAELVTFQSTGSEAVHCALAIARGATGRSHVVKFDGHFHGWIAPFQTNVPGMPPVGTEPPYAKHPAAGYPESDDVTICPWNEIEAFEALMAVEGDSIAAVIMEPVACNGGTLSPLPGYLERVRELCDQHGTVLIFDEIITGFRLGLGGAQQRFGVTPDLATFAKAMANGFPISAVAGRREIMTAVSEGPVRTRGTYNGNPVAVAAANAVLAELERRGDELYGELERRGALLAAGIERSAHKHGVPLRVVRVGSVLSLLWGLDKEPVSYREVAESDVESLSRLDEQLTLRGIYTMEGKRMYVSAAHTDEDIELTIQAFDQTLPAVAS